MTADAAGLTDKVAACIDKFNTYGFSLELGGYAEDQVDATIEEYQNELDGAGYQDILKAARSSTASGRRPTASELPASTQEDRSGFHAGPVFLSCRDFVSLGAKISPGRH